MTVTRRALSDYMAAYAKENGIKLNQPEANILLAAVFDKVIETLKAEDTVSIHGLGRIYSYERKATRRNNPKNPGQLMLIPAKRVYKFKEFFKSEDLA